MVVLVLVGPKGCGKSTLGRWLAADLGGHFLDVELIAREVLATTGGKIDDGYSRACFAAIASAIDRADGPLLILETTGAAPETEAFLDDLRRRHQVRLVRVRASKSVCSERIATRDASRQVDVPPELIEKMHALTEALSWQWDGEIDNDRGAARADAVAVAQQLLPST